MGNEVGFLGGGGGLAPALRKQLEERQANRVVQTVPTLSYEGKQWTVVKNGQRHVVTTTNDDGDEVPVTILRVVILAGAPTRGRTYYSGEYNPNTKGAPVCWSDDGRTPHASVKEKQSDSCKTCPHAVKGSKVTAQGNPTYACGSHRMLAVVPANALDSEPLRVKLATTSDYDEKSPEAAAQKWFAYQQLLNYIKGHGLDRENLPSFIIKMRFDPKSTWPKVQFQPDKWLSDDDQMRMAERAKSKEVQSLLGGTWTPAGADGKLIEAKPIQPATVDSPTPTQVVDADYEEVEEVAEPAPVAPKTPKKTTAKVAKPVVEPTATVLDDSEIDEVLSDWS